jgi:hypothetical protein
VTGLREYGPWVFSFLALSQFWIYFLLRRRGRKRLEAYASGTVEVGFDTNGPLIGLAGVLRPLDKEVFVQSMEVTLVSDKDKSKHEFRWIAFKPNFLLPLAGSRAWEMAHPFLVSPGDTHRFNVVLHDVETSRQMKAILQTYYHHWHETEAQIKERTQRRPGVDGPDVSDLITEFKRKDACVTSYTELDRQCYWAFGDYELTLKVLTEGGEADFTRHFRFHLGKADAKSLKTNLVAILEEPIDAALGKTPVPCQCVQAEYSASGAAGKALAHGH